ncbi:Retrovirus-related Pol polyprotein from transposon [Nosema granulosis]|uniref:Retrovirus-related Pol polyprotein from transposon n=1 Tax=Nosema granulosis TaxID=83296 RepID=A0A9P6KZ56_9MICR|nr:Retrovirus-related Pol polyprotein from transposon [Nosema granulosis]
MKDVISMPSSTQKYCSYHKSNFHNTSECRAKKECSGSQKKNLLIKPESGRNAEDFMACNLCINDQNFAFVIDTGAQENYVSDKNPLLATSEVQTTKKMVELANGDKTSITKKITLKFRMDSSYKTFEEEFYILPSLPYQGVLGFKFLQKHNCNINCGDHLLLFPDQVNSARNYNPDQILRNKTDLIYSLSTRLTSQLRDFKGKNPVLGHIRGHTMSIPLTTKIPIHKKPYPISLAQQAPVKEEIQRLLDLDIIRKSSSPYASPAFPVGKKNGQIRLVIDYRGLNSKTVKLGYPFPNIQYSLMDLKGSEYFSQIDLNMGYYQIPVAKEDIPKTAFVLPFGQYEFLRMPFGLCNAPREF